MSTGSSGSAEGKEARKRIVTSSTHGTPKSYPYKLAAIELANCLGIACDWNANNGPTSWQK